MRAARDGGSGSSARAFGEAKNNKDSRVVKYNSTRNAFLLGNVDFILVPCLRSLLIRCGPMGARLPCIGSGDSLLYSQPVKPRSEKEVAKTGGDLNCGAVVLGL